MTLTKAQIVEALFAKNIFTKTQSAQIIDTLFELIKQSLQNGEDVLVSGFGKFSVKEKQARRGRNPQTGEPMTLPPRKVVTFKKSVAKTKADEFVKSFLKPLCTKELPEDYQWNYVVDIFTKWYQGYFYFCSTRRSSGTNAISEYFESRSARLQPHL